MTDPTNNAPMRIPIESDDDPPKSADELEDDTDTIEIDGDALDFDADLNAEFEAEIAAKAPDAPAAEPVDAAEAAEAPAPAEEAEEATEVEEAEEEEAPVVAAAEAPAEAGEAFDTEVVAEGKEGAKPGEISREAVFEMMQELRQQTEQIARLGDEKNDLYDKLLRKQAEFENFRKRGEREMQEAYIRARADVLLDLLPIIDNFDLALHHAENASPEVIQEGVQLIYRQLLDTLGRLGLEPINAEGQPFDPELHDAVATETTEEVPDNTVLTVLQRGFKLGDRMLRHARVKVSVQP
jgi:molecular chaperone GrpE